MDNNVIIKNDNNIMMAQERRSKIFLAWYHHCPLCLCYIKVCCFDLYTATEQLLTSIVSTTLQNTTGLETETLIKIERMMQEGRWSCQNHLKILETCKKRLYAPIAEKKRYIGFFYNTKMVD